MIGGAVEFASTETTHPVTLTPPPPPSTSPTPPPPPSHRHRRPSPCRYVAVSPAGGHDPLVPLPPRRATHPTVSRFRFAVWPMAPPSFTLPSSPTLATRPFGTRE